MLNKQDIQAQLDALPENYKTADVDRLIRALVKEKQDLSFLRPYVLREQQFHRIYFHGSLKQIKDAHERLRWLDRNLLFSDWWHTDENIDFVKDVDIETALSFARRYVRDEDPFIRRWGYVMFISKLCRDPAHLDELLALFHNDEAYYSQMAQAWLIAELAVFFPEEIALWLPQSNLRYEITGKAIQKICDSFRIDPAHKERFKALRPAMKAVKGE